MAKRFIKVYEQIVNWEWFKHPNTLCLFIYLLVKANYKDLDRNGKVIKRGQVLTSLPKISTDTGLSIQQTRTALNHLVLTGEITDESSKQYRIITVVKYDDYQTSTDKSQTNQQETNRRFNRRSTDDSTACIEYIESIEKDRKIESIDTPHIPPAFRDDFIERSFDTFWACYPKKASKPQALRAWRKLKPDPTLADQIMTGLQKWSESYDWLKDGGQYIPYPATWLNNRKWEDDVPTRKSTEPERPVKRVSAQQYEQRDYTGIQAELMDQQDRDMEEFMRKQESGEI